METEQFKSVLTTLGARDGAEGWVEAPGGRTITLYAAHNGATLTVPKAVALRVQGDLIHARTQKGETYIVLQADVFAAAIDGAATAGRKAGFL